MEGKTLQRENGGKIMNAETLSKVFISYGHDEEAITSVTNFVENLGLKATVLDEQLNNGLTVIEYLKKYPDDWKLKLGKGMQNAELPVDMSHIL